MATKKLETLVSSDGAREWTPETAVQATNLRAQGWKSKAAVEAEAEAEKPAKASTPASNK
jgi:hypothetical protein